MECYCANFCHVTFPMTVQIKWFQVKHGNCGPVQSIEVQRQLVARTPVFYRLEKIENGAASVGYMRLKEFNALARKDLVIGKCSSYLVE